MRASAAIPMGHDSISPNRHLEIRDAKTLLDFIARVRDVSGRPTGFKTVFGSYDWLAEVCEEIQRRGIESAPDFITVDSGDGGTGAAPMTLLDNVGLPVRESLPHVVDMLRGARSSRAHQSHRQRQDDQSGRRGAGAVRRRGLREFGARVHVCARLHPGHEVQQEHLSDGHHDPRQEAAARPGRYRQGRTRDARISRAWKRKSP